MNEKGDFLEKLKKLKQIGPIIGEYLKNVFRGHKGLSLDDDVFSGLLDIKDIRERTRVNDHEVYAHSYMRLVADIGGEEWETMRKVADMEDHYLISLDGQQRQEAILMQRAKAEIRLGNEPLQVPPIEVKKDLKQESNKT